MKLTSWQQYNRTEEGRAKRQAYAAARRAAQRAVTQEARDRPCARCGGTFPYYVMDFHHRDPDEKEFNIGPMVGTVSLDRLVAEIAKCDVLCANCHRIVEYGDA